MTAQLILSILLRWPFRYGHGSYDPIEKVWRWLPEGPYETAAAFQEAMHQRAQECKDRLDLIIVSHWSYVCCCSAQYFDWTVTG